MISSSTTRRFSYSTPRWVLYDKVRLGAEIPKEAKLIHQEGPIPVRLGIRLKKIEYQEFRRLIMKWHVLLFVFLTDGLSIALAGDQPSGKTLAATMEVYVFPKSGQSTAQQSKDEAACYDWATSNVGYDPFQLSKQAAQQKEATEQAKAQAAQAGGGAGARGALGGAAAGAVIGEIADDDAGKGAAIGATAGAIASRRKARAAKQQATQQAEQQGQAKQEATQNQIDNFKKAFSVCLEAKDYLVKY